MITKRTCHSRTQIPTVRTTVRQIMASSAFQTGVAEVRAGQPPRYDIMDNWNYERGRLWAIIAPINLDPGSETAIKLYTVADAKDLII
jgi:hypothetical protein